MAPAVLLRIILAEVDREIAGPGWCVNALINLRKRRNSSLGYRPPATEAIQPWSDSSRRNLSTVNPLNENDTANRTPQPRVLSRVRATLCQPLQNDRISVASCGHRTSRSFGVVRIHARGTGGLKFESPAVYRRRRRREGEAGSYAAVRASGAALPRPSGRARIRAARRAGPPPGLVVARR